MKIKNFKINKSKAEGIFECTLAVVLTGGYIAYNLYESQKQVCDEYSKSTDSDIFIDNDGNYCKNFEAGEHVIKISSNDVLYHKYGEIEGYTIESVEVNGWRYNNTAVYVNNTTVTAIGKNNSDGYLVFDDFGTVQEKIKTK